MQINLSDEEIQLYRVYEDERYYDSLKRLLKDGRKPLTVADVVKRRLEVLGTPVEDWWWGTDIGTTSCIVFDEEGNVKIVPDATKFTEFLERLSPRIRVVNSYPYGDTGVISGWYDSEDDFRSFDGIEHPSTYLYGFDVDIRMLWYGGTSLVWEDLVDPETLIKYSKVVCQKRKQRGQGYLPSQEYLENEVYLGIQLPKPPTGRPLISLIVYGMNKNSALAGYHHYGPFHHVGKRYIRKSSKPSILGRLSQLGKGMTISSS